MSRLILRGLVGAFVVAALAGSNLACESACTELSNFICKCETTETRQQACVQRIGREEDSKTVSAADQERCTEILDGEACTCDSLARGELEACGLARATE